MEPDELMRRYRKMARQIAKQIPLSDDWYRAGGECVCSICGLKYADHPVCSEGLIVVLCSGDQVKL